jgi:hypothetical protein
MNLSNRKKYIITLIITQALSLSGLFAQDWKFKSGEEDWGETLYATQKNAVGSTITIFTAKEDFRFIELMKCFGMEAIGARDGWSFGGCDV